MIVGNSSFELRGLVTLLYLPNDEGADRACVLRNELETSEHLLLLMNIDKTEEECLHRASIKQGWSCMSTGEKVAVALVLDKADWLAEMDYSMAEAIERTGSTWVALMPAVCRELRDAGDI